MTTHESGQLLDLVRRAELALRRGVTVEASERVVEITDRLQAGLEPGRIAPGDADLLRRMVQAQQAGDWIGLADMIAYEVPASGLFPGD